MLRLRVIIGLFIGVFLCLEWCCHLKAQNDVGFISQISLEQGLSDRTIKDIAQDRYGYIWIGTRNGLNRYDGLHIVTYDNHPLSQTRISHRDIQQILCRKDGSLVIEYANRRAIDVLVSSSTQAQKVFLNEENGILGQVEKLAINETQGELHVLVTRDSTLILQRLNDDLKFDSLFTFQDYIAKPSSTYNLLVADRGKVFLNESKLGIIVADTLGQIHDVFLYDSLGVSSDAAMARIFRQDKLGRVWLNFDNTPGLWEFNEAAGYFTPFQLEQIHREYDNLWEDALGNVIITTISDRSPRRAFMVTSQDDVVDYSSYLVSHQRVNEIYSSDFERLLFVGTTSGVKKNVLVKKRVIKFLTRDFSSDDLFNLRGIVCLPDHSVVISGNAHEWHVLHPQKDSISAIDLGLNYREGTDFCDCARELVYDPRGYVWGTRFSESYKGELVRMSLADTSFRSFSIPYQIESLILGLDSTVWFVASNSGQESFLTYLDETNYTFHHYFLPDGSNPLADFRPTCLYESSDRTKWVGTTRGLVKIDKDGQMDVFQFSENNYYGLVSNMIYCIVEDSEGNLWIGTDAGVNRCKLDDTGEDEFEFFDARDGLADNNVRAILEDDNGNMWFSTAGGLSYFDRTLKTFRNFGIADGFSQNEFNKFSFSKDQDGNFFIGGTNGLNYFNPNELLERNLDAPILLSELSYYDKVEDAIIEKTHNLQDIEEVVLPASNRYFHCAFALADYAYPELNQFQYKLENRDPEWNWIGTQNTIRFNNLSAGNYVLKIRGADRNLNLSSTEFALPIRVKQFFYKSNWFALFCIILGLLFIYLFHKIRVQQVIKMERLRTKISSDLHDDVGGLLSGLAMQTELLEYTAAEKDKPKLKRISDMSRNAMAQMRDVIWATDARKDRFEDLIVRMREFAAEILFSRGINCNIQTKGIVPEKKLPVQVRQNLYLIFKEAITNVAKHSNATDTQVELMKEGSVFEMTIKDNGTGKETNGQKSSLNGSGLKNMRLRAKNLNAQLDIDKQNGFKVSLRMKAFS